MRIVMKAKRFPRPGTAVCLGAGLSVATARGLNDDGQTDILWRKQDSGENAIWFLNGVTQSGCTDIQAQPDVDWRVVGTGDFNNDGQTDILWRHARTGQNAVWYMNGGTYLSTAAIQTVADTDWEIVGTGYFN